MKPEIARRIENVVEGVMNQLVHLHPDQSAEAVILFMREQYQNVSITSAYQTIAMHQLSQIRNDIAAVDPAEIPSLIDLLVDPQKRQDIYSQKSNRVGRSIHSKLEMIRDRLLLPLARSTFHGKVGRPSEMPGYDEGRAICEYIVERTTKKKIATLRAQEEASNRWKKSVRMIQRVWEKRDEFLDDGESENNPND